MAAKELFNNSSGPTIAERRGAYRKIMFTLTLPRQQRAVLRAIHEHAGLIAEYELTLKQIADYLNVSVCTVRDAKNWLVMRDLLIERQRFRQRAGSRSPEQLASTFTISWLNVTNTLPPDARDDVLRMLQKHPRPEGGVVYSSDHPLETSEGVVQISDPCTFSSSLDSSSCVSFLEIQNTQHSTAHQRALEDDDVECGAVGFENGNSEADANRSQAGGDNLAANSRRAIGQTSVKTSEVSPSRSLRPSGRRGNPWPFEVTAADLADPIRIKTLFAKAVERGWWIDSEQGRLGWATLCVYVAREGREPGKLLTICARSGKHDGTQADESKARRLVEVAWSGIDSAEAEERLDAMCESEFREWLIEVGYDSVGPRSGIDGMVLYGRGLGSSTRPRLIREMANWIAAEAAMI